MNGVHIEQPRGRFALTGGRVILPQHIVTDKTIIVEGGKIVAIADRDSVGSGVETIAVDGRYIAPGLIDIHIHGALGYTFNQPTPLVEAVRMVSLTPARVIGFDSRKGSLEPGKDADIAIFEEDFTCWRTIIGGHWAYRRR